MEKTGIKTVFWMLFLAILPFFSAIFSYDSDLIKVGKEAHFYTYFGEELDKLRISVKPRFIHLVDTRNSLDSPGILSSGVLFTYKNYHARQVYFISNLDRYVRRPMIRNKHGVWYYLLDQNEFKGQKTGHEVRYKFVVDGLYLHDETHSNHTDDDAGGMISQFFLQERMLKSHEGVIVLGEDAGQNRKVLFRIHMPQAGSVSLVGSFNKWDSEMDSMEQKEGGYFEVIKSLPPGEYVYLYRVDGEARLDSKNMELKYHPVFGRVSYFRVK